MTEPVSEHDTLFITDAELIRRLGVPEKIMRDVLRTFDSNTASGFPKKQKLFGDRRYWPAVREYLDHLNRVQSGARPQDYRRSA